MSNETDSSGHEPQHGDLIKENERAWRGKLFMGNSGSGSTYGGRQALSDWNPLPQYFKDKPQTSDGDALTKDPTGETASPESMVENLTSLFSTSSADVSESTLPASTPTASTPTSG